MYSNFSNFLFELSFFVVVSNTMNEIMKEAATSSGNNTGRRMPLDAANRDYLKQSPRENVNSTVEAHVQSYSSSNQSEIEHYDPRHRRGDVSHANQLYLKPKEESHGHNSRPHSGSMHGNTSQSMGPMLAQEDDDAGHYEPRRRGDLNTANRMYLAPRNDDRNRDNGDAGTSSRPNSSNRGQLSTGESQGRKWDTSSHTRDETLKYLEQQAAAASLVQNRHPPSFNPPARYDAYEDSFEKE